jgi:hypothetical protein
VELAGGMLQGIVSGVVRAKIAVEVAQNSDANGVAHGSDCTRGSERRLKAKTYRRVRTVVRRR